MPAGMLVCLYYANKNDLLPDISRVSGYIPTITHIHSG